MGTRALLLSGGVVLAGLAYACTLRDITGVAVGEVVVSPPTAILMEGSTLRFTAQAKDPLGNPLPVGAVVWSAENSSLVSVGADGTVEGLREGQSTIWATLEGVRGSATVTVEPGPTLAVSPDSIVFWAALGEAPQVPAIVQITNAGGGTLAGLSASVEYPQDGAAGWLTLSLAGTSAPSSLTVSALTGSLGTGIHVATIRVDAQGAKNSPLYIPVVVEITLEKPVIALSTGSLELQLERGDSAPAPTAIQVTNAGAGTLAGLEALVSAVGWLSAHLTATTAPAQLVVQVNPVGLHVGTYRAGILVRSSLSGVPSQSLDVTLRVVEPSSADLGLTKTGPANALLGDTVQFVLVLRNAGPDEAVNVTLVDSLPESASFLSATGGAVLEGTRVLWDLGTLAAGAQVDHTVSVRLAATGPLANVAVASSSTKDPNPIDNRATFTSSVSVGPVSAMHSTASVPNGTVGTPVEVVVQGRDARNNPVPVGGATVVVAVTGANTATPEVTDNRDGTYTARYTPVNGGTDQVAVTLNGTAISGSPFSRTVGSGPVSALHSTASVPSGTVGSSTTIVVYGRTAGGGVVAVGGAAVVVTVTGANTATPAVTDNRDGTYTATYTPTITGTDQVAITLNGTAISGSPYSSTVSPAPVSGAHSTASVPNGTAGSPTTIVVQGRDAAGNSVTVGGASVVVVVTGANTATPEVTDNGNGTYTASYTPATAGTDQVAITLNGTAISGSPYTSTVSAGAVSGAHSTASVPNGTVGSPTTIVVQGRDAGGNPVTVGGASVSVVVTGANTATPSVTDNGNGTYTASYTPATVGTDQVAITLNGTAISGSPYASTVSPAPVSGAHSTASVPNGTVGVTTTIVIQGRDAGGNPLTVGGATVSVVVTGANTATPSVTDNGNGTYTAGYTPATVGTDQVAITLNGTAISGSPYSSTVSVGPVSGAHSTASVPNGTAGNSTTIVVQGRDVGGNPVTVGGATVSVVVTGANTATPGVTDNGNGTYTASYTPTTAGTDQVAISLNGTTISGSPYTSTVSPGLLSPAQATASVPNGTVGNPTTIVVQGRDAWGNPVTVGGASVSVVVTGANTATPGVTDNGNGTYTASYTPTTTGTDQVAVTMNGTAISGSPYTSTVSPPAVSGAQSTASVPNGTAGNATTIVVQGRDAAGNPVTVGGATVVVVVTGANSATPAVTDNGDGTYTASYTPTTAGTDQVAITMNGAAISGSPYASTVSAGPVSGAQSTASVPNGTAGGSTTIAVQSRDAWGNPVTVGGATVSVVVTGANSATPAVTDNGNGTYSASYSPTTAGTDQVAITLNGTALSASPYASTVSAGPVSGAQSTASVPNGEVGSPTTIIVQGRDEWRNPVTVGGATVVVVVTGANTATPTVTDNGNGTYTASYTPTTAGIDQVAITLNGTAISGSPFTSTVGPGPVSPAHSTASVPNGTAGSPTTIVVQARNRGGNPVTVGGATVVVVVTGANTAAPPVTDNGDGTYTASYTPTTAGVDQVAITMNGTAISGSPYTSNVSPGPVSGAHSTASVPNGTVGSATTIVVQGRDAFGNPVTVGGAAVSVVVTGANTFTLGVADNGNGTYTASYTPTAAGADQVAISLNGTAVSGSPFTSTVSEGESSAHPESSLGPLRPSPTPDA